MTKHSPHFLDITTINQAAQAIDTIGSDPKSIEIMAPKMIHKVIEFERVLLQDAIIIKQDMLSLGGEVAIPKDCFTLHATEAHILVCGTITQLQLLVEKLKRHYKRLHEFANELEELLQSII